MDIATVPGKTVHLLRNTRYTGKLTVAAYEPVPDYPEWYTLIGRSTHPSIVIRDTARECDIFATEEEARAEGRARRKPRTVRKPTPLYGDFATIAMLNGIRTDGSGRRA